MVVHSVVRAALKYIRWWFTVWSEQLSSIFDGGSQCGRSSSEAELLIFQ